MQLSNCISLEIITKENERKCAAIASKSIFLSVLCLFFHFVSFFFFGIPQSVAFSFMAAFRGQCFLQVC